MSTSSEPGLVPPDADDIPPVTFHRRKSEGGLHKESVEEVLIGTIVGLTRVDYQFVQKVLTRLISNHKDLYVIVYSHHDPLKCRCRSTKVYQKILEELGNSRPKIVYCFLASFVMLRLQNVELTSRKLLLTGDLAFLRPYTDSAPKSNQ